MHNRRNNKWLSGSAFVEFSLIIGVVALALAGMDYYIRRGIMARTKDITDYLLSHEIPGQVVERQADNTSVRKAITSDSDSEANAMTNTHMYRGGGTGVEVDSSQTTSANSRVEDLDARPFLFDLLTFIPWQGSVFDEDEVSRERYEQYQDGDHVGDVMGYDWENDDDTCRLEAEFNKLRDKAETLDTNAEIIETTNSNLNTANNTLANNPVIQFFQAILDGLNGPDGLRETETDLSNNAADMRRQAQELRERAGRIEERFRELREIEEEQGEVPVC